MSFTRSDFMTAVAAPVLAAAISVGFPANANAAPASEPLTCHIDKANIDAAQTRILKTENMVPVTSHFKNVGSDASPKWGMATLMLNPQTKKGYEWARMPDGEVCISKRYSNVELYANTSLDPKAFMDTKIAPRADDVGKDYSSMGANAALLISEKKKQFPMYRAQVDDIINLTGKPLKTPTAYVEYLVGNPSTKEGTVLASNFNGLMIREYLNVVGTPQRDGVKFGAIYSPVGEDLVRAKTSVAVAALDRK